MWDDDLDSEEFERLNVDYWDYASYESSSDSKKDAPRASADEDYYINSKEDFYRYD